MEIITELSASNSTPKEPEDSVDLFFKRLALTVKNLPPNLIAQAKIKCLTFVTELEQQSLETPIDKNYFPPTLSPTYYSNTPPFTSLDQF